jgi:DNA polymerase III sliding clamp (beta) subunit (PCNA family)
MENNTAEIKNESPAALTPEQAAVVPEPMGVALDQVTDVSAFASTDSSRYVLNGIHLGKEFVEATDGRMLVRAPYPVGYDKPAEGFILPGKDVKSAVAGLKKCRLPNAVVKVEKNCTKAKLVAEDVSRTAELVDGNWPNTDQVWPGEEPKFSITLSARLLVTIATYVKNIHAKDTASPSIRLDFTDATSVTVWSTKLDDGREVKGLLMPMRMT